MLFYRLFLAVARPIVWIVFRPRIEGRQHVPAKGGVVIGPNHLSGFDVFALAYALAPRPVRYMGKNQLFRRRLVGPLVRSLGAFPARDGEGLLGGVAAARAHAARGEAVVIFPEGARRRGRTRKPLPGAARTALAEGVPLFPAAIRGTDGWRRLVRWQIALGAPIPLEDLAGGDPDRTAQEATVRLWDAVTELEATLER
jgi:1-acyl-sn-glycerol-3-phosphate acyltransferase